VLWALSLKLEQSERLQLPETNINQSLLTYLQSVFIQLTFQTTEIEEIYI